MGSRRADRFSGHRRRAATWRAACQALLLVVFVGAWPGVASAATSAPRPAAAPAAAPAAVAPRPQPAYRALCPPAAPGYVACLALVRADIKPLARAAVAPGSAPAGLGPGDFWSAYALPDPSLGNGSGITVAVVDASDLPTAEADLAAYRSQLGLSAVHDGQRLLLPRSTRTAARDYPGRRTPAGTARSPSTSRWSRRSARTARSSWSRRPRPRSMTSGSRSNEAVSRRRRGRLEQLRRTGVRRRELVRRAYFNHPGVADHGQQRRQRLRRPVPGRVAPRHRGRRHQPARPRSMPAAGPKRPGTGAGSGCSQHGAEADLAARSARAAEADRRGRLGRRRPGTGVAVYPRGRLDRVRRHERRSPIIAGVYALAGTPTAGHLSGQLPVRPSRPAQRRDQRLERQLRRLVPVHGRRRL